MSSTTLEMMTGTPGGAYCSKIWVRAPLSGSRTWNWSRRPSSSARSASTNWRARSRIRFRKATESWPRSHAPAAVPPVAPTASATPGDRGLANLPFSRLASVSSTSATVGVTTEGAFVSSKIVNWRSASNVPASMAMASASAGRPSNSLTCSPRSPASSPPADPTTARRSSTVGCTESYTWASQR